MLGRVINPNKHLNNNFIKQIGFLTSSSNHIIQQYVSNKRSVVNHNFPHIKENASVLNIPYREPIIHRLTNIITKEDINQFIYLQNHVIKEIMNNYDIFRNSQLKQWYSKMMLVNMPSGEENPGITTAVIYKLLAKPESLTKENIKLANILGIIIDMSLMVVNIHDDIIDKSILRKGFPCWYRFKNKEKYVIRDIITMLQSIFVILRMYFHSHPYYIPLLTLLRELYFDVCYSEHVDLRCFSNKIPNIDNYNMETYYNNARYSVSCSLYYLPLYSAMFLAEIYDNDIHKQVKDLCIDLCMYTAIENDYFDCFGDTDTFGKDIGSDIREGRCSWIIAKAVSKATSVQKEQISKHIGEREDVHVMTLIDLFRKMGLEEDFYEYREETYDKVGRDIENLDSSLSKKAFYTLREIAFKRNIQ